MRKTIYVGGLASETSVESLCAMLAQFGPVEDARLMTRKETGDSRGFAYVTFSTSEAAKHAKRVLDGAEFEGARLRVDIAR